MASLTPVGVKPPHTIYRKSVKPASANMLKPGANNAKLGGIVTVGKWQDAAMYSLSLEERATCPPSCEQWNNCYGNNMPFAHRFDHTDKDFLTLLDQQLSTLAKKHKATGFVVRLHVLGDFYSADYTDWWTTRLDKYPELRVFGYTHQDPKSPTGGIIALNNTHRSDRWVVRFSDEPMAILSSHVVDKTRTAVKGLQVICPEQTGGAVSCAACGLCWSALNRQILFIEH
jgi:hypothetical protein